MELKGTYNSVDTAKAAVTDLINQGHERTDLKLLASSLIADELADATRVEVITNPGETKSGGIISKLFKKNDNAADEDPFAIYKDDVAHGKIVILLDK